MLCNNYQVSIREAVDSILRREERQKWILHSDFGTFHDGIRLGCYVCRNIWESWLQWRLSLLLGVGIGIHELESFAPRSRSHFDREIMDIKHVASIHRQYLLPGYHIPQVNLVVCRAIRHTLGHGKGAVVVHQLPSVADSTKR